MEAFLIPKPQPNFPHEDVNEVNAQIFTQLLLESTFLEPAHELAEQNVEVFKVGHQTLKSLSLGLYMDRARKSAFSYGAMVYEALSLTVRPIAPVHQLIAIKNKSEAVLAMQSDPFSAAITLRDEEEKLLDEAPNTSQVLLTAAALYPHLDSRFVLMGGALERSIDKDTIAEAA